MCKECVSSVNARMGETNGLKLKRQRSVLSSRLCPEIHKNIKQRLRREAIKAMLFADDILICGGEDKVEVQRWVYV